MARLSWLLGAVALVLLLDVGSVGAQERVPVPGAVYSGRITDQTGECSRGVLTVGEDIQFGISDYGSAIRSIGLTGLTYANLLFTPSSYTLSVYIPVADDGSFNQDFSQFGVSVHIEGRFEGTTMAGSFRAAVGGTTECEGTFSAQTQVPERRETTFSGTIDAGDGCGGGTISITRSADLLSVTRIAVEGFQADGRTFAGAATFDEGTVPIDPETGSFGWAYFSGREPGQEIAVSGIFSPYQLSGAVTVSPSTCGPVRFTTYIGGRGGPGLPATGSGPSPSSTEPAGWWLLAAAALGLAALATGLALSRRRVG